MYPHMQHQEESKTEGKSVGGLKLWPPPAKPSLSGGVDFVLHLNSDVAFKTPCNAAVSSYKDIFISDTLIST